MLTRILLTNGINFESIIILLAYLIVILVAIVLHELAHGYVAYLNGDFTAKYRGRLSLNPAKHFNPLGFIMMLLVGFGWAKPVPIDPRNFRDYKKGMLQTASAGVICNLILAFLASICLAIFLKCVDGVYFTSRPLFYFCQFLLYLFYFSMQINITLMVFNLLPIQPLDGFKIVETLAEPDNKFVNFMYRYGNMVLLGFLLLSYMMSTFGLNSLFGMVNDLAILIFNKIWGAIAGVTFG